VDVDAYVAAHEPEWRRLDMLVRRRRRLTGDEVDELVTLYQRTTTHLSAMQSAAHDPVLVAALSSRVARARATVTGAHAHQWGMAGRFALVSFPAMAYRARWWWLGTALGSLTVALLIGWWVARSPAVQAALLPRAMVRQLVNHQFRGYYSRYAAPAFAAQVWTNNAWLAAESTLARGPEARHSLRKAGRRSPSRSASSWCCSSRVLSRRSSPPPRCPPGRGSRSGPLPNAPSSVTSSCSAGVRWRPG
jgi:hypothetical protein